MQLANATAEKGLYISLRLDGRVRASGTGSPPWQRLVRELPPNSGERQDACSCEYATCHKAARSLVD